MTALLKRNTYTKKTIFYTAKIDNHKSTILFLSHENRLYVIAHSKFTPSEHATSVALISKAKTAEQQTTSSLVFLNVFSRMSGVKFMGSNKKNTTPQYKNRYAPGTCCKPREYCQC